MTDTSTRTPTDVPATGRRSLLFEPVPLDRVAVLRVVIYLFAIADIFLFVNDVVPHAAGSQALYFPVDFRTSLHLPVPSTGYVEAERVVVVLSCLLCAWGRLPRLLGMATGVVAAAAFTDWVSIGMSYSKVDHDHFALIVAVWVLPTVGVARRRLTQGRSEAAGWALLCIQIGCVATYFLSAVAKVRFGGWDWVTGSTFTWAMIRRGTPLGHLLVHIPDALLIGQFGLFALELCTPLLLVLRGRWRYRFLIVLGLFHLATYATLGIHFLPLVVCLLAFLPLERLLPERRTQDPRHSGLVDRSPPAPYADGDV